MRVTILEEGTGQSPPGTTPEKDSEDTDPHREGSEQSPPGATPEKDSEDKDPHREGRSGKQISSRCKPDRYRRQCST